MNGGVSSFIRNGYRNVFIQGIRKYSGHSKWQNIKATKEAQDQAKSLLFKSLGSKMKVLVAATGDPDPSTNSKLASLIDQARKSNMPTTTINNILEKLKNQKSNTPEYSVIVRNSTGAILILYLSYENINYIQNVIAQIVKKFNSKMTDSTVLSSFDCASYITALKDCNIDQAMEDAIHTDADDVQQIERNNETYYEFKCKYLSPDKTLTQLKNLGYTIESIENKCIPHSMVELNEKELDLINKLKERLKAEVPGLEKIEDNIAS